jgi:hypothetical protein
VIRSQQHEAAQIVMVHEHREPSSASASPTSIFGLRR